MYFSFSHSTVSLIKGIESTWSNTTDRGITVHQPRLFMQTTLKNKPIWQLFHLQLTNPCERLSCLRMFCKSFDNPKLAWPALPVLT